MKDFSAIEEIAILRTIFNHAAQLVSACGEDLVAKKFLGVPIRREHRFACVLRTLRSTEMQVVGMWAASMTAPSIPTIKQGAAEAHSLARAAVMAALGAEAGRVNGWLRDVELRLFEILSKRGMKPRGSVEAEIAAFDEGEEEDAT